MEIKVLGVGCPKCKALEKNVHDAVDQLKIQAAISKVEDIIEIMNYGIMSTPGLVIDGRVVSAGRLLNLKQVKELIIKYQQ